MNVLPLRQKDKEWKQKGYTQLHPFFVVKSISRTGPEIRYGIVVKKKVGSAVVRNKIKRRLRHVIRKLCINASGTYIIIVKNAQVATYDFALLVSLLRSFIYEKV